MKLYLIAGEASGDLQGSLLLKALLAEDPSLVVRFWGGDMMQAAAGGIEPVRHYREGAVMGFGDVLSKGGQLLSRLGFCTRDILSFAPDAVVLIDYPGFNMSIARFAHAHGIKVVWYIAPKTWASRSGRNRLLRRYVDELIVLFPFEKEYFESVGVPCMYLGNPLVEYIDSYHFTRIVEWPYVAVLPGSREAEVRRTLPVVLDVARLNPSLQFVVAAAPGRDLAEYEKYIGGSSNVSLVAGRTYDVLKFASAAIINSGTASLEAALIGTPQVVVWSTSPITAFIARKVLKVLEHIKYISLGNLIDRSLVFKELIQEDFNPSLLGAELSRLLGDPSCRAAMLAGYSRIRSALSPTGQNCPGSILNIIAAQKD